MPLSQYPISRHSLASLISLAIITGLAFAITYHAISAPSLAPLTPSSGLALA